MDEVVDEVVVKVKGGGEVVDEVVDEVVVKVKGGGGCG